MAATNSSSTDTGDKFPPSAHGVVTKASPHSVAETLDALVRTIQAKGLTLFDHIDHGAGAREVGLTMHEAHVLIFGSAKAGTPLMVAAPLLALDLPLKALVWQDNGGQVWVSYNSTSYLAERYAIPDELANNIAGIDAIVDTALRA